MPPRRTRSFVEILDYHGDVVAVVEYTTHGAVEDYAVVLVVREDGERHTVRVYDGAHGRNEMHRYTLRGGKQAAEVFHRGTLAEGLQTALEAVKSGYQEIINGWRTS